MHRIKQLHRRSTKLRGDAPPEPLRTYARRLASVVASSVTPELQRDVDAAKAWLKAKGLS